MLDRLKNLLSKENSKPFDEDYFLSHIEALRENKRWALDVVYDYVVCDKPKVVNRASKELSKYLKSLDVKSLINLNETLHNYGGRDTDIRHIESLIKDKDDFIWMMRLGTCYPNGYWREKCLRRISSDPDSYMFIILRLSDWVDEIRQYVESIDYDMNKLTIDKLVMCLYALEKVKRSYRSNKQLIHTLENRIAVSIRNQITPANLYVLNKLPEKDRFNIYRVLVDSRLLSKDELNLLLNIEKSTRNINRIIASLVQHYDLSIEEVDKYINHRNLVVQNIAIEKKYELLGCSWEGIENKLLSPSSSVRETVRFILHKHTSFDCRKYYVDNLDSNKRAIAVLGIGETGASEDVELLRSLLKDEDIRVVRNALHALSMKYEVGDLDDLYWEYLQDDRTAIAIQAYREIISLKIKYGAEKIYNLMISSDSDVLREKLLVLLTKEHYWDRLPYLLMLYGSEDAFVKEVVRRSTEWRVIYTVLDESYVKKVESILDNDEYKIPDKLKSEIRFNMTHAVK